MLSDLEVMELVFEWRDIKGYEGLYKVSEYGDVMALNYHNTDKKRLLSQRKTRGGYIKVDLCKNGIRKTFQVHRLVATAFCEGSDYFPEVNHIDEDKTNNHYSNLEWCTREYNINYGTRKERVKETRAQNVYVSPNRKKVKCIELGIVFDSIAEAGSYINRDCTTIIHCLSGKQRTSGGYHWEYVD